MSPERWQQIEEIFEQAVELPAAERARYIEQACGADAELRAEVEKLVGQDEEAGEFLQAPLFEQSGVRALADMMVEEEETAVGQRIGAYRIEGEIGRGGMGAVYLAVRADNAFQRRVAIKLIKRGMDTDFILRRFRHERQILAALDHPNIARLYDGGATEEGQPYFVMEYIEGQPLYAFCDSRRLSVRERLQLFCQVCEAVEYAHRNQVIHRDIKPSNILVTSAGLTKLFDFGIAKLLNSELSTDTSPQTATAMRMMTVEYASPEQVQGYPVTFLSDVYSLGVLLYELLTGHRPYRFPSRMLHEMSRIISEEEPERPSLVVNRTDDLLPVAHVDREALTVTHLCEVRSQTPAGLSRELSGSLDRIVLKALRKNPRQRYQSAAELREDLMRHLEGRPISAPIYFAAGQTRPVQSSPAPAAGGNSSWKSIAVLPLKFLHLNKTEDDADDQFLSVGLADSIITRLSSTRRLNVRPTSAVLRYGGEEIDPLHVGRELAVDFVLDGRIKRVGDRISISLQLLNVESGASVWARRFDERFTDALSIEDTVSQQATEALMPHLESEERRQSKRRGTDNPEAFEAYLRGRYYWNTFTEEGFAKALVCYNRAVSLAPEFALAYTGIADYYNLLGVYAVLPFAETSSAAKEAALKAVELDDNSGEAFCALGFATLMHDFDWEAAGRNFRRGLELNPDYATGRLWYCYYLGMIGEFDDALRQVERALELDPLTPIVHHMLSWTYYHAHRFDESLAAARRLVEREPQYGLAHIFLCLVLSHTGRHEEAIEAGTKGLLLLGRTPYTLIWLASAYAAGGQTEEARKLLAEIEQLATTRYVSPYLLAMIHHNLGDHERAIAELERALDIRDGRLAWMGVDPQFDALRENPTFTSILRRTGNPILSPARTKARQDAPTPSGQPSSAQPSSGQTPSGQPSSGQLSTTPIVQSAPGSQAGASTTPAPDSAPHVKPRPTEDDEAYQLYVAGHYYATRRTAEGLRQAIERLERAVERDPQFALAHAELSDCYALLNWYVEPPPQKAWQRAKEAALKAVAADDELAESHASLGFVTLHHDRDFATAEREFARALELKPDHAVSRRWHAFNLSALGRHDEAVAEIRRAQEISPRSPVIATAVANVLFLARRFDEAIEQCRRALELDPGSVAAYVVLRWTYEMKGMHDEALSAYEQERVFAGDTPTTRAKRAHVLAAIGRRNEARQLLEELLARREEQWVTAYEIAVIYSLIGDRDEAFRWLAQAEREHAVGFTFVRVDPHLDRLRTDPRFTQMLQRLDAPARYAQEDVSGKYSIT